MARLLISLVLVLLTSQAFGASYYIDPAVEDGGVGSEADPFNSFADLSLSTSDDVYVKAGTAVTDNSFTLAVSGASGDHVTIGKYGTGANPVWTIPDGQNQAIYAVGRAYFDINDIDFAGGTANQRMVYLATCRDFTINRCTFSGTTALRGVYVYNNSASADSYNWEINDCIFSGMNTGGTPIYIYPDSATHTIYDWKVHGCTFTNTGYGIRIYYAEGVSDVSMDPYGSTIEECTFTNLRWSAIWTCGLRSVEGHPSYWQKNILTTIGASDAGNVNAIQASNCKGLKIRWNTINGVDTSVPDGHGIILDWSFSGDPDHICDGVEVYGNEITGCTASNYSAGISNFQATNSKIYNNYCYGNGTGIAHVGPAPTGATYYNNTCVDNVLYGLDVKSYGGQGAVIATVRNNIFSGGSIGLAVRESSTAPTESHNCYYNNADYTFRNTTTNTTLDTTSAVTANPLLDGYKIGYSSPCKDTGIALSAVTTDIVGRARAGLTDIGAFEFAQGCTATMGCGAF